MFNKQQPVVHKSNSFKNNLFAIAGSITKLQIGIILTV